MVDYAMENSWRIVCPEQDVINLVCYSHIKKLPKRYMVCPYSYDDFKNGRNFQQAVEGRKSRRNKKCAGKSRSASLRQRSKAVEICPLHKKRNLVRVLQEKRFCTDLFEGNFTQQQIHRPVQIQECAL
jgi:hypothetical protein